MSDTFSDDLGNEYTYDEIRELMDEPFTMELVEEEAELVKAAVNQGIDSHLEACFIPDRGDSYEVKDYKTSSGKVISRKLACRVSKESLPVLLRRLFESNNETAWQLGHDIIQSLRGDDGET